MQAYARQQDLWLQRLHMTSPRPSHLPNNRVLCSSHTTIRGELSPVKRQSRNLEHELGLARQEGQVQRAGWL